MFQLEDDGASFRTEFGMICEREKESKVLVDVSGIGSGTSVVLDQARQWYWVRYVSGIGSGTSVVLGQVRQRYWVRYSILDWARQNFRL